MESWSETSTESDDISKTSAVGECYDSVHSSLDIIPYGSIQVAIGALYLLTSAASLLGNGVVICVQIVGKESSNNIRKYLLNLAISDLFIGVLCVPFTYTNIVLGRWIFPHWLCPTAQFVQLWSVFITSSTLTIIGFERYIATLHPFSRLNKWFRAHARWLLWSSWLGGVAFAYVPLQHTYTRPFQFDNGTYFECSYDNGLSARKKRIYMACNLVITFVIPLLMLCCSYSAIMRRLMRTKSHSAQNCPLRHTSYQCTERTKRLQPVVVAAQGKVDQSTTDSTTSDPRPATEQDACNKSSQASGVPSPPLLTMSMANHMPVSCTCGASHHCRHEISGRLARTGTGAGTGTCTGTGTGMGTGVGVGVTGVHRKMQLRRSVSVHSHRQRTIKMLFTIVILYCVCWAPIKCFQLANDYGVLSFCSERQFYALIALYTACHWLAMANSFVNPIVYSFMSQSFRNDLRKMATGLRSKIRGKLQHFPPPRASQDLMFIAVQSLPAPQAAYLCPLPLAPIGANQSGQQQIASNV